MAKDVPPPPPPPDLTSIFSGFEVVVSRFVSGLEARLAALAGIGRDVDAFHDSLAAGGTSAGALALQIFIAVLATVAAFVACRRWFARERESGARRIFATLAAAVLAIVAGLVVQRLLPAEGLAIRSLRIWVMVVGVGLVALATLRGLLTRTKPPGVGRLAALARDLSIALIWSIFGVALMATMRLWGAGPGLRDLLGTLMIAVPVFLLFGLAVWKHSKTLAAAIAGSKPRHRWHAWLARIWPKVVLVFLIVTFVTTEIALTLGVPLPGLTVLATIVIVFLTPRLDTLIASKANRAMEGEHVSIVGVALRQTLRFAVVVVMLTMLGAVWASPLASGFGINLHAIAAEASHIALIATAGAFLWNILGAIMGRIAYNERRGHDHLPAPRSRLGTLVPLIRGVGKATIVALVFLSVLVTMGVNVWPLITGLSVFGLAIGFGSQTLVKDIVSGLFFLVDDAFRLGEYIETSGAKGTVEKISVRSVTLRNPRGPVATVPYGQISKIQNFSRDYAIDKIQFRVAFDTDVELVRKLFKKIGLELMENPDIASDIIEPFKSQGVFNVEDGTLVVRGKCVTKPGRQTVVRRHIMKAVHQAFRENGIRSVPKPLTGDATRD